MCWRPNMCSARSILPSGSPLQHGGSAYPLFKSAVRAARSDAIPTAVLSFAAKRIDVLLATISLGLPMWEPQLRRLEFSIPTAICLAGFGRDMPLWLAGEEDVVQTGLLPLLEECEAQRVRLLVLHGVPALRTGAIEIGCTLDAARAALREFKRTEGVVVLSD